MSYSSRVAARTPSASAEADRIRKFRRLDTLLWLCWAGLPFMIGIVYWDVFYAMPTALAGATAEEAKCLNILPNPANWQFEGKVILLSDLAIQFSIYFVVLGVLHRMVRKFIAGQIFVSDTLAGLKLLGGVLMIWPFLTAIIDYGSKTALKALGDYPGYMPVSVNVDLGVVAMGGFLLTLRYVIEHAMDIKADQELTI
jgi:Protein of unknown function (DUF2975)